MSIQAAKEELKSLTPFQEELHVPKNLSEEVISSFYTEFIKCTWYSSIPMRLKCTQDGDEIVYTVNDSFHLLEYTYLTARLPRIRVKDKYKNRVRIAWCHNIGNNIIREATFKEDDEIYQSWDHVWGDIYPQFYQDAGAGKRESHNIGMGNLQCIEGWSELLPSYPINIDQPWFYSACKALAFPIFYKNSLTRAEHRYKLNRKIVNLLRVQVKSQSGEWKDLTKSKQVSGLIDVASSSDSIRTPELWGRYALITDTEINWFKCKDERVMYIRNVENCDTANPTNFGSKSEVALQSTNPCVAMFWVAENTTAQKSKNYSNYTTNADDLYKGWDPVRTTSLMYGTTKRLDHMTSDHFSIAESRKRFPSAPSETGYHGYAFSGDSMSYHADIGVVLQGLNAVLQCDIYNNDIFDISSDEDGDLYDDDIIGEDDEAPEIEASLGSQIDSKREERQTQEGPSFITRVRLLVMRKFTITKAKRETGEEHFVFKVQ